MPNVCAGGTFRIDFTHISHPQNAAHAHPISTHTAMAAQHIGRSESCVWEMLDPDLVRSVAKFLPFNPLTPKLVWRLSSANKSTRDALKEWLKTHQMHTSQAKQLCAKMGKTPSEVASYTGLSFPKELDSADFDVFGMLADYGALCNVIALTSFVFNDKKEQAMLSLSKALASKGLSQLEMLCFNSVCDAGLLSLLSVINKGCLPKLKVLHFFDTNILVNISFDTEISDVGAVALVDTIANCKLKSLKNVSISNHTIGDRVMKKLEDTCKAHNIKFGLSESSH